MINTSIVPRVLMGLLVAAYLVLGYFAFLLFYPFETIVVHNEPFPIKNAPVVAGQVVIYTVDYCRYTDVDAVTTRTLVGDVSISLGKIEAHFPRGCAIKDVADSVIPSFAPPGRYYIQIDSNYQINNLRSIEKHFRTATFDIVAPPSQPTAAATTQNIISVQPQPSGSSSASTSTAPSKSVAAAPATTTAPPPTQPTSPPPKQPTTSSPPPDNEGTVHKVVNTVLQPVNGVLDGVTSLLHP